MDSENTAVLYPIQVHFSSKKFVDLEVCAFTWFAKSVGGVFHLSNRLDDVGVCCGICGWIWVCRIFLGILSPH